MKNKILFILLLLVATFFISSLPIKVNAEIYNGEIASDEYIPNVYIRKVRPNGSSQYKQAKLLRQSTDNAFVYCLQPFVEIDNNYKYNVTHSDYVTYLDMTAKQWDQVSLIAYYGYGYGSHTSKKWWAITQVMIWRVADPSGDYFFTKSLNGEKSTEYDDEINEIETLVSNHNKSPKFSLENKPLSIGQSITLNDSNKILNEFKVKNKENVDVLINGNSITIKAIGVGDASIKLAKEDSLYESPPIVYFSDKSQDVLKVGSFDPIYTSLNFNVVGAKVEIIKKDKDTGKNIPQGMASLENAEYGIYDATTDQLIEVIKTDKDAKSVSNYLPNLGDYYLKEITPSLGYKLDNDKYYFTVDEDNLLVSVDVYEEVITRDFEFTKVFASSKTGIMKPEAGIEFEVYNHKNELVSKLVTDEEGKMYITLPYGEYILKQITSPLNYEKIDDYHFEVKEEGHVVNQVFSDAEITARLKVIKVDKDTGNVIKRANIKFKIFDIEKNEYVKQTITYPQVEVVEEYSTNSNGILVTPYPLSSGKYLLEEVDRKIDGYIWNGDPLEFEIGENSELIEDSNYGLILEVKFGNKSVKGEVEVTKYGEELIIENNSFRYEKIKLSNVIYELYANEDIYSADGSLVYKKDQLISSHITNEGYFKIENMNLGDYYLVEKETIKGHVLDNTKHFFSLEYKDQYTSVVSLNLTFYNCLEKSKFEFTKKDLISSETLPNTKIQIFSYVDNIEDSKLIYEGVTDSEGKIVINNLFVGKFYLVESEAPDGYVLSTDKMFFEIRENGEIVKAEMTNEKLVVEVPDTNLNKNYNLYFVIAFLTISGIGIIIYGQNRKK
ncbi:MAG: hypothetical protein E7162_01720 [Firmicutes bacterium]|nr:hypothetical protein [Bacillota bacterium]